MPLNHSPSFSTSQKTIFQKLFGKVKGAMMALGILSSPLLAQTSTTQDSKQPQLPPIEERLVQAQKMNLENIDAISDLEDTIAFMWSQLKDTPGAPKEIRDQYGHITTEGLIWIESELPADYLRRIQKYKNMERELEKMDKKDPNYGTLEYSIICLGALLIGVIGYQLGKVSKKELDKLKYEHSIAHDEATKHMRERALAEGKNKVLERKIATLEQENTSGDEENMTLDGAGDSEAPVTVSPKIPEWMRGTFFEADAYKTIRNKLIAELSSGEPSQEAQDLQDSVRALSDTTGTIHVRASRLNNMSEKFISYARYQTLGEETIHTLLCELEKSFRGQEIFFGRCPVIDQPFDNTQMIQVGTSHLSVLKVEKIVSLPVLGPNTHPQAATKSIAYAKGKVLCR